MSRIVRLMIPACAVITALLLTSCGMPNMPDFNFWSPEATRSSTSQNVTTGTQTLTTAPGQTVIGHNYGTSNNTGNATPTTGFTTVNSLTNTGRTIASALSCPVGTTNIAQETNIHQMQVPLFTDLDPLTYGATFRGSVGSCPAPPLYAGGVRIPDPNLACNVPTWSITWSRSVSIVEIRILVTPISAASATNAQTFVNGAIKELTVTYGNTSFKDHYQNNASLTGQLIQFLPTSATNISSIQLHFESVLRLQNNTISPNLVNDVGIGISEVVICGN